MKQHPDYAEMRAMRDAGLSDRQIAARFGMTAGGVYKTMQRWDRNTRETPEKRAFRRFPITSHKPASL